MYNHVCTSIYMCIYCRHQFDVDAQFIALCRILTDQSQPMNNKVKQAWLEYVHELIPLMNSEDFKDNTGQYIYTHVQYVIFITFQCMCIGVHVCIYGTYFHIITVFL